MEKHPLTEWRKANHKAQAELSATLGVSLWTITSIETGRRRPSLALAKQIEAKTGIPKGDLLAWEPAVEGEAA